MNILLFLVIGAVLLYLVGFGSATANVLSWIGLNPTSGELSGGQLYVAFAAILGLGAAFTIIAGTFSFPNPYVIFAPLASVILVVIITTWGNFLEAAQFPSVTIPGVGSNLEVVTLVVGTGLGVLGLLSVISFLKGGEW